MTTLLTIFGAIFAACFGAIFGSYATLFAYRLPRGESCFGRYFGQKSRCPNCEAIIKTRDLIPVINWLITLGKCRNCHIKIPRTHLFIELCCTLMFVLCYLRFGFGEEFMLYALLSVGAIILLVTYHTHKVFPFEILIFLIIISVAARVLHDYNVTDVTISSAIGAISASIFYKIFGKNSTLLEEQNLFPFMKFLLVAAVLMPLANFLLYFSTVCFLFSSILLLDLHKRQNSLSAALIFPFLVAMLLPPILS